MSNFLISPLAPWLITLAILATGLVLWRLSAKPSSRWARWSVRAPSLLFIGLAVAMFLGASLNVFMHARVLRAHPPPGTMVDVDGIKMHVWCEGPTSSSAPTLFMISGGYGQALWLRHLQRELTAGYRTCLMDRPGLGWSDARDLPNDFEPVMAEMRSALEAAGERFPMVLVGYSWGGLFAADFAGRYPEDVAGLVLLDPTAPSHVIAYLHCGIPPGYHRVLQVMFGLGWIRSLSPLYHSRMDPIRAAVGEDWDTLAAFELRPSSLLGQHSSLTAHCRRPTSTLPSADGLLGDLPLLQVIQTPKPSDEKPEWLKHLTDFEYSNHRALDHQARFDYPRMSSRSSTVYAPVGAGHEFPMTEADFTLDQIRGFMLNLAHKPVRTE